MLRLAALVSHPIQYFAPLFRAVAERPEVDLTVYFCSRHGLEQRLDPGFGTAFKWDVPLLDGYRSKFLPAVRRDVGPTGFARPFNPAIVRELGTERYDAIWIHGHFSATNWLAMAAARMVGTRVLLRSESNLESLPRAAAAGRLAKAIALRLILSSVDACLYIGHRNREYYRHYGVADGKLFFAPYVVDNAFFQRAHARLGPQRSAIRSSYGVNDARPIVLYVGKLTPKKQPMMLLRAFSEIRKQLECALLLVGDGELRREIEAAVGDWSIPNVYLTGFLNQSEVARAYCAGDVLVLPSAYGETWGLVVNEAMNFGLPVVVSDGVGCGEDLVRVHENGCVFRRFEQEDLLRSLSSLLMDGMLRRSFGRRSRSLIDRWGLSQCAEGIVSAVRFERSDLEESPRT